MAKGIGPVKLTRADQKILKSYIPTLQGLAAYLGSSYEIVLHSLEDYDHSVIGIINGEHTGRRIGAPITDLALDMLDELSAGGKASTVYFSRNKKGEPLHSTTIAIRGENQRIIGLLCINFYLNTPYSAIIKNLIDARETSVAGGENFVDEPAQLVSEAVNEMQRIVLADASIPASDKNKEIIARLYQKGIFKFKDSVADCAAALGISRNTVYMHIRSCK